jgi:hypothetical protein
MFLTIDPATGIQDRCSLGSNAATFEEAPPYLNFTVFGLARRKGTTVQHASGVARIRPLAEPPNVGWLWRP